MSQREQDRTERGDDRAPERTDAAYTSAQVLGAEPASGAAPAAGAEPVEPGRAEPRVAGERGRPAADDRGRGTPEPPD